MDIVYVIVGKHEELWGYTKTREEAEKVIEILVL
jgi:hypothetical protein